MGNNHTLAAMISEYKKEGLMELEEWQPSSGDEDEEFPVAKDFSEADKERVRFRGHVRMPRPSVFEPEHAAESDVFVKIEKFKSAKKTLGDIKEKLEEIDELIKRIRETKLREEQEFSFWERELTSIKSRVNEVTENIFEKVD